jgi:hypothetical protein
MWRGDRHDRWWVMWYQLWLSERVVHGATLAALGVAPAAAGFVRRMLDGYADHYLEYPNRDNVLGPSRPFFSTYLESIWLLQLCVAMDVLDTAGLAGDTGARVRDRVLEPSMALIASYDEGGSNRQAWNNAALIAAGALLDESRVVQRAIASPSGVIALLSSGLLADGTWYEGENYHFFAHRGLWYGVTMMERMGVPVPAPLRERFDEAFATPLLTALPDFTFPARRDSQYGVSLRQWRFAESCELGLARREDPRLAGALWTLYESGDSPRGDTGRWRSTAEAERNEPATALDRTDLGWRSLLFARAELPVLAPFPLKSVLLSGQGLGVLRRNAGRAYLALDYGHSGGGHGHPDRLNVLLSVGDERWLDDPGTGSYVDASLHWYRSTLAHNAPLVNGRSQCLTDGMLRAYDERDGVGWVDAHVPTGGIAPGVRVSRSVVAMPNYALDRVEWASDDAASFALPLHIDGELEAGLIFASAVLEGGEALDDGFVFVHDTAVTVVPAATQVVMHRGERAVAWISASTDVELWRIVGPGAPGSGEHRFHLLRARGTGGRMTIVWSWAAPIARVVAAGEATAIEFTDGATHTHRAVDGTWHVDLQTHGARSSVDLDGRRRHEGEPDTPRLTLPDVAGEPDRIPQAPEPPLTVALGRDAYRTSEASWEEAGCPRATVSLRADDADLVVDVDVRKSPVVFRAPAAPDPELDNDDPDIHSDGVQLYLHPEGWSEPMGRLAVPVPGGEQVRAHRVGGSRRGVPVEATWHTTATGYAMRFRVRLAALREGGRPSHALGVQVVVNDMSAERTRRRGQLVLSGGAGERVYLRGDRESPAHYRRMVLPRG